VACIGENNAYRILVENPEGKGQLGRPSRGLQVNIKINLTETGWGMYWTELAQDGDQCRLLLNTVMKLRLPFGNS
jgi:hypothetical protein